MSFDWNDLKYLLAISDHGSTIRAGVALRVSQTTVSRRLEALEAAVGLKLVDRTPSGYNLTTDGQALLDQARGVEVAAKSFSQAAQSRQRDLGGTVKITTEEIVAVGLLGPILKEIATSLPDVRIALDSSEAFRDLANGDADIAIRSSREDVAKTGTDLVGRRVGDDEWAIFCSKTYAEERAAPRMLDELRDHPIVAGGGPAATVAYQGWLDQHGLAERVSMQCGSAMGLLTAVRTGLGVSLLPMLVALPDADLRLCFRPNRGGSRSLWLLSHNRARHNAAVRKVSDFLFERLKQRAVLTASLAGD
jgi:DNA-binding transcriptional LysR family regulator